MGTEQSKEMLDFDDSISDSEEFEDNQSQYQCLNVQGLK